MNRKEQLRETANKALAEIWEIEYAERREKNRALIGKCFAFRNCFSCPEGPDDYWILWQKVVALDDHGDPIVFRFQTDKNDRIEIDRRSHMGSLGEETSEEAFMEAWRKLTDQVGSLGANFV